VGAAGLGKDPSGGGDFASTDSRTRRARLFLRLRELLRSIQNSYNPEVKTTELELLQPIFAAEVLVIDDLGAQKPNEWVWDTVALILNTRYNDNTVYESSPRITLIASLAQVLQSTRTELSREI